MSVDKRPETDAPAPQVHNLVREKVYVFGPGKVENFNSADQVAWLDRQSGQQHLGSVAAVTDRTATAPLGTVTVRLQEGRTVRSVPPDVRHLTAGDCPGCPSEEREAQAPDARAVPPAPVPRAPHVPERVSAIQGEPQRVAPAQERRGAPERVAVREVGDRTSAQVDEEQPARAIEAEVEARPTVAAERQGGQAPAIVRSEARREVPRQQDVERQLQSAVLREAGRAVEAAQPARHSQDAEAIRPARHHSRERDSVLAAVAQKMVAVEESQPAETRARPEQVQSANEPDRVQADRANAAQESRREPPALPAARIASPLEQAWVDRRETVEARERTADPKATPRFADDSTAASQAQPEAAPASWGPWARPEQRARAAPEPESAERVEIAPEPDRVPQDEAAPDAEAIRPVLLALASARIPGALEVAALKGTAEPVPAIRRSAHQPEVTWRDTVAGTLPAHESIETVPDAEDSPPRLAPPGPEPDPAAATGDRGGPSTTREEGLLRLAAGPVNLTWHSMDRLRDAADAFVDRAEENGWGWRAVWDLRDLGDQTAGWLEGRVAYHPGYCGGPNEETEDLIPTLARLNRAGFVTTFSQPGFPPDENGWTQRAAVEGLADAAMASRLAKAAAANGLVCSVYPPPHPLIRNDCRRAIPVSAQDDFVHTYGDIRLSRATVRGLLFMGHGRAGRIAARAWQVTVTDPQWGRNTMWDALERWACSREGTEPE